jgi:hypothetical protein
MAEYWICTYMHLHIYFFVSANKLDPYLLERFHN